MEYDTKKYIVTGESANVRKFPDSSSGAIVTTLHKGDIVEADSSGVYTNTRGGTSTVYLPIVVDGVRRWAAAGNFAEYEETPLGLAALDLEDVYASCIGCRHVSGSYSWAAAMSDKKVNCAIPASRVATLAGILPDGKRISHKAAVSTNILTTKTTIAKSMNGYDDLDLTKCTVTYVGAKNYAALPGRYKKAGAIFVQDSNIAVCGGDGSIYACHNWSKQMKNGKYDQVRLTSGYCFNSPILVVILPNDRKG
ncbi:MAG: hypothetical protein LUE89_10110 [Clostridiales bacterium]|nr:hypothetical protein [Clostridiales bacterium]